MEMNLLNYYSKILKYILTICLYKAVISVGNEMTCESNKELPEMRRLALKISQFPSDKLPDIDFDGPTIMSDNNDLADMMEAVREFLDIYENACQFDHYKFLIALPWKAFSEMYLQAPLDDPENWARVPVEIRDDLEDLFEHSLTYYLEHTQRKDFCKSLMNFLPKLSKEIESLVGKIQKNLDKYPFEATAYLSAIEKFPPRIKLLENCGHAFGMNLLVADILTDFLKGKFLDGVTIKDDKKAIEKYIKVAENSYDYAVDRERFGV